MHRMRAILGFRSLANAMYMMPAKLTGLHRKPLSVVEVEVETFWLHAKTTTYSTSSLGGW
jgi:hypothetical protein